MRKSRKIFLLFVSTTLSVLPQAAIACEACQRQQPRITRGLTHGTGPESNWDWLIVSGVTLITVVTFVLAVRYLARPGEKNVTHIKNIITALENE